MYLCTRKTKQARFVIRSFGVWCNGNTADSGPAFPGSSPGTPTRTVAKILKINNLAIFLFSNSRVFPVIIIEYPFCEGAGTPQDNRLGGALFLLGCQKSPKGRLLEAIIGFFATIIVVLVAITLLDKR